MASTYSDYNFYKSEYGGMLSEEDYVKCVEKAYREIVAQTFGRSNAAGAGMYDSLRFCECEIVDAIHEFSETPGDVVSVNNDGYAVSYRQDRSDAAVYARICKKYLTDPDNLMFRGVMNDV